MTVCGPYPIATVLWLWSTQWPAKQLFNFNMFTQFSVNAFTVCCIVAAVVVVVVNVCAVYTIYHKFIFKLFNKLPTMLLLSVMGAYLPVGVEAAQL